MEAEYEALLECAQEMNFVNMLLQEITEVWRPEIMHEDNQGAIFLATNRQVGMRTKHTNIRHHFMRDMAEEKDRYINYIRSKVNRVEIMTKCFSKANCVKYTRIIRERKLLGLVETGRENVKNNGITNGVTDYE